MRKIGLLNAILIGILLFLSLLFLPGGLPSVISWIVIKMALPMAGLLLLLVILIKGLLRRKRAGIQMIISVGLCAVYIAPILITMNVIPVAYPANIHSVSPSITVQWPLTEETIVAWGGNSIENNTPHAMWGSERWAYDLVMEPYNMNSPDLESYGIWNKEVVSPVYGTVVAVYDDDHDIPPNQEEFESLEGNYVYIQIEQTGTYILLNHLKKDSVVVRVGDTVSPGDVLGRVGNSGTSSEPHLHIHHQRQDPTITLYPLFAEGLPLYFDNPQRISMPEAGTIITP